MTSILKPKNPNPSNTLTYNNMPLKKLISMNAVFLNIMIEKPPPLQFLLSFVRSFAFSSFVFNF